MAEQKFNIGEEVYITDGFSRPTKCRIVDFGNFHDPRFNVEGNKYCIYIPNENRLTYRWEEQLYKTKKEAYIEMLRSFLGEGEGDELSITVDDEFYTIKIKKGE